MKKGSSVNAVQGCLLCKTYCLVLLVYGAVCKWLQSHHSLLTTSKKPETEKLATLLGSESEGGIQGKPLRSRLASQAREFRETRLPRADPLAEPLWEGKGRKTRTVMGELLEAPCGQVLGLQMPGNHTWEGGSILL